MTIQKLEELLNKEESEKLDFKLVFHIDLESNKKEFAKDVCAIANSKGGRGYIIFGVKDKTKEIVGVSIRDNDEERVQQLAASRLDPPVPVRLETVEYQGKTLAVLTIFKSAQRPHQVIQTGTFYIRRGSTSDMARRHEIAAMLQENGLVSWEKILLRGATLESLDWKLIRGHIAKNLKITNPKSLLLLEGLGVVGRDTTNGQLYPTMGGILLFGKDTPYFFPSAGIRIETPQSHTCLEGNIPCLLSQSRAVLDPIFQKGDYPLQAVNEALYNAIVHRDYWDSSREILVYLSSKQIEIINPGAIWRVEGQLRIDDEFVPPRRNQWLYQRLLFLEQRGHFVADTNGLGYVKRCFADENAVKFINLPRKNLFKVVLPGLPYLK